MCGTRTLGRVFTLSDREHRPGGRAALGVFLLSLWLLLLAVPASAHDSLVGSDPDDGDVLSEPPTRLEHTYTGEISDLGAQFMVTGPEGRDVVKGTPTVEGTVVTQELAEELTDGDYEVAWRVTSSDGHPISGTYVFTLEAGPAPDDQADMEATDSPTTSDGTDEPTGQDTAAATGDDGAAQTNADAAAPTTPDAADETTSAAAATTTESSDGIPGWGWLVAAVAALGLVACGFLAFRRN